MERDNWQRAANLWAWCVFYLIHVPWSLYSPLPMSARLEGESGKVLLFFNRYEVMGGGQQLLFGAEQQPDEHPGHSWEGEITHIQSNYIWVHVLVKHELIMDAKYSKQTFNSIHSSIQREYWLVYFCLVSSCGWGHKSARRSTGSAWMTKCQRESGSGVMGVLS